MVTIIDKKRIYTGETPVEELQRKFKEELTEQMKKAALEMNCSVHELKWRVDNGGVVEIEKMTGQEIIELAIRESEAKRVRDIKDRNV